MKGNGKRTKLMYWACGMISSACAVVFLWLMLIAQEMILGNANIAQLAGAAYLYIFGAAVPCALAVGMLAAVIYEIGQGRAFTVRNAKWMRGIAAMAFLECAYIAAGVVGWSIAGLMHPGIILLAMTLILFGCGVGILALSLAGLVVKANDIREENELTV